MQISWGPMISGSSFLLVRQHLAEYVAQTIARFLRKSLRHSATAISRMHEGNLDTYAEIALLAGSKCIVGSYSTFSGLAVSMAFPPVACFSLFYDCEHDHDVDFWERTERLPNF